MKVLWKSDCVLRAPSVPGVTENRADLHLANALCKEAAKLQVWFLTPAAELTGEREGQLLPPSRDLARAGHVWLRHTAWRVKLQLQCKVVKLGTITPAGWCDASANSFLVDITEHEREGFLLVAACAHDKHPEHLT